MTSGGSELAPTGGYSGFFGGTGNILGDSGNMAYSNLASQWGTPYLAGPELRGYQRGMESIMAENQDSLKDQIYGNGTDWNKYAQLAGQLGQGLSAMGSPATAVPMQVGALPMQTPLPARSGGGGVKIPHIDPLKMQRAADIIRMKFGAKI